MLDRTNRRLIALLQKNARLSNKELAVAVDLAPSSCLMRMRRLEETNVLKGYHARVDPAAIGVGLQALVSIQLKQHAKPLVESFQSHAMSLPEVVQVFHLTGSSDFLVHVAVRDSEHLRELALTAFTARPEVARIETSLVYAHHANPGLPMFGEDVDAPHPATPF